MRARLREQGFEVERTRTVSHFRVPLLKRLVPAHALAALDGAAQWTGEGWTLTPSVFVRARRVHTRDTRARHAVRKASGDSPSQGFRCPACGGGRWLETRSELSCQGCGARWAIEDGIYDFKTAR
jgi:hypothetical protein